MTNTVSLAPVARKQVIDDEIIEWLEQIVEDCRNGTITEIMIVCNEPDVGAYSRTCGFEDFVRALGALEYAKTSVLKAKGLVE